MVCTGVEIVERVGTPLLYIDVLVFCEVLEVVGEGREGSPVYVDLLIQLEHLQEFYRVEAVQLKLSRVDRHIFEIPKLPAYRSLPHHYALSPHIILKLQLLLLLILFLPFLLLKEDILSIDLKGILEYLKNPIPGDQRNEEKFSIDRGDRYGVIDEQTADFLLDLLDIIFGHLNEGLPEEEVVPVELGVEEESVGGYEHPAGEDYLVGEGA